MKQYQVRFSESLDLGTGVLLDDFSLPWKNGACPRTEFRSVWNEAWLAFHFSVDDDDLVLGEVNHGDIGTAALNSDRVELFFASSLDLKEPYFGAEMDVDGRVYDYQATTYRQIDDHWSFETLSFSGERSAHGYEVSGRVAFRELRDLKCLRDDRMITGVYRADFSHQAAGIGRDWITWVDPGTEAPDFHVPESFGQFLLVD